MLMACKMLMCMTTHCPTDSLDRREIRRVWTPGVAFLSKYKKANFRKCLWKSVMMTPI